MTNQDDEHASQDDINNEEDSPLEEAVRWVVERALASAIAEDVVEDILDNAILQIFGEDGDLWRTSEGPPSIPESAPDVTRPKLMEEDMVVGDTCGAMMDEINKIISGIQSMSITSPSAGSLENEVKKMISAISSGECEQKQHPEDIVLNTMEGQRRAEVTTEQTDSVVNASGYLQDNHEDENGHVSGELLQRMIVELEDDSEEKATEHRIEDNIPTPITIKLEDKKEYQTFKIQTIPDSKVILDELDLTAKSVETTPEGHININLNSIQECMETSVQAFQPQTMEDSIISTSDNCASSIEVWRPNPLRSYLLYLNECIENELGLKDEVALPVVQKMSNLVLDSDDNDEYQSESDGSTTWEEQEVQIIDPDDEATAAELPIRLQEPSRTLRETYAKSCYGMRAPPKHYAFENLSLPTIRNLDAVNEPTREELFLDPVSEKDRIATTQPSEDTLGSDSEDQSSTSTTKAIDDMDTCCESYEYNTEPTMELHDVRPSVSFKKTVPRVAYNSLKVRSSPRPNLLLSSENCPSEYFSLHITRPNEKFLSTYSIKDYIDNSSADRFALLTEAGALLENTDIIQELRNGSISDHLQQTVDPSVPYPDNVFTEENPLAVISQVQMHMTSELSNTISASTNFIFTNQPNNAFDSVLCSSDSMGGYFPFDKLSNECNTYSTTGQSDKLVISEYVEKNSLVKTTSELVTATTDYLDHLEVSSCVPEQDTGTKITSELGLSTTETTDDTRRVQNDSLLNELDDNINNRTGEADNSTNASIVTRQTYGENSIHSQNITQPSMVTNPCDQILIMNYDQNIGRESALFLHSAPPTVVVAPESRVLNYNPVYEGEYVLQFNPIDTEQTYKNIDDKYQLKMHVTGDKSSSPIPIYVATLDIDNRTIRPTQGVNTENRTEEDNHQVTEDRVAEDGGTQTDHSVEDQMGQTSSNSPNADQVSTGSVNQETSTSDLNCTEERWENTQDNQDQQEQPDEDENVLDSNTESPGEVVEVHSEHTSSDSDEGCTEDRPDALNIFQVHLNLQELNDENVNEPSHSSEQHGNPIHQEDNPQQESTEQDNPIELYAYDIIEQQSTVDSSEQQDLDDTEGYSQNIIQDNDPLNTVQMNPAEIHEHIDQRYDTILFVNTNVDQRSYFDHTYAADPTEIMTGGSIQGEETIGRNQESYPKDILLEPLQSNVDSMLSINEPPIREMACVAPTEDNNHKQTHMEDHTYAAVAAESTDDNMIQDNNIAFSNLQSYRKDSIMESIRCYEEGKTSFNDQCVEEVIQTSLRVESVTEETRSDNNNTTTPAMESTSVITQENENNTSESLDVYRRNIFLECTQAYADYEISINGQCVEEVVVTSPPVVSDLMEETLGNAEGEIDQTNNVNPHDETIFCVSPNPCIVILEPIQPHEQCWNEVFQTPTQEEKDANETSKDNTIYEEIPIEDSIETNLNEDNIMCVGSDTCNEDITVPPLRMFEELAQASPPESEHKAAHIEDHTYAATAIETITYIHSDEKIIMGISSNTGRTDNVLDAMTFLEEDQESLKKHCSEGVVEISPPEQNGRKSLQTEENDWAAIALEKINFVDQQDTNIICGMPEISPREIMLETIPPQEQVAEEVVQISPQEECDLIEIDTEDHILAAVAIETIEAHSQSRNRKCNRPHVNFNPIVEPIPPQEQAVEEVIQILPREESVLKETSTEDHSYATDAIETAIELNSQNENRINDRIDTNPNHIIEPITPQKQVLKEGFQISSREEHILKGINTEQPMCVAGAIDTDIDLNSQNDNRVSDSTDVYPNAILEPIPLQEQVATGVLEITLQEESYLKEENTEDHADAAVAIETTINLNSDNDNICSSLDINLIGLTLDAMPPHEQCSKEGIKMSTQEESDVNESNTEEHSFKAGATETNPIVNPHDETVTLHPGELRVEGKLSTNEQGKQNSTHSSRCEDENGNEAAHTDACGCATGAAKSTKNVNPQGESTGCCSLDTRGKTIPTKPIQEDGIKTSIPSIDDQNTQQVDQTLKLEENGQNKIHTEEYTCIAVPIENISEYPQIKKIIYDTTHTSITDTILEPVHYRKEDTASINEQCSEEVVQMPSREDSDAEDYKVDTLTYPKIANEAKNDNESENNFLSNAEITYGRTVLQESIRTREENKPLGNDPLMTGTVVSPSQEESEPKRVQTEDHIHVAEAIETTNANLQKENALESTQSHETSSVSMNEQTLATLERISSREKIILDSIPTEEAIKHEVSDAARVDNKETIEKEATQELQNVGGIKSRNPIYEESKIRENDTNSTTTSDSHEECIQPIDIHHPQGHLDESQNAIGESSEAITNVCTLYNKNTNIDHDVGSAHKTQLPSAVNTEDSFVSNYTLALTDSIDISGEIDQRKLKIAADGKEDGNEELYTPNPSEIAVSISKESEKSDGVDECLDGHCCGETLGDCESNQTVLVGLDGCSFGCIHNQIALQDIEDDEHDETQYSYDDFETESNDVMEFIECSFAEVHAMPREKEASDLYELYDENNYHIFEVSDILASSNVMESNEYVEMPNFDQSFIAGSMESRIETGLEEVYDYCQVGEDFLLLDRQSDNDEICSLRSNGSSSHSENGEPIDVRTILNLDEVTPLLGSSSESDESDVENLQEAINSLKRLNVDNTDVKQTTENLSLILQKISDAANETHEDDEKDIHKDIENANSETIVKEKSSTRIYWTSVGLMKESTNNQLDLSSDLFGEDRTSRHSEASFMDLEDQGDFSPNDMFEEKEEACASTCTDAIQSDWSAVYYGSELATVQESGQESINEGGEATELANEEASCSINEQRDISLEEDDSINDAVINDKTKKKKRKWKIGMRVRKFFSNIGSSKRNTAPTDGK